MIWGALCGISGCGILDLGSPIDHFTSILGKTKNGVPKNRNLRGNVYIEAILVKFQQK